MDAGDLIVIGPIDSSGAPTVFLHRFCKRARRSAKRTNISPTRCAGGVFSPNTRTSRVPKVPKGCSGGFWHFWHLITLGFSKNTRPSLNIGERRLLKDEPQER